jgi:hypothetical protein
MGNFLIGDVLAVVGFFVGVTLASWATILFTALTFARHSERAKGHLKTKPWKAGLQGVALSLILAAVGFQIFNIPTPLTKIIGFSILFVWATLATIGAAGMIRLAAERMRDEDPRVRPWTSMVRSAAYLTIACLLPFIGTFGISFAVLLVGTGAGFMALLKEPATATAENQSVA